MKRFPSLNRLSVAILMSSSLLACASQQATTKAQSTNFYGTQNDYASEQIYFLLTDRFVDGDKSNNFPQQGGETWFTFNRPLVGENGESANVGYMGGDFQGVLNNAQYIKDMGFTSVWLTPIHDNPDQAFNGGEEVTYGAYYKDGGKTGYHGYWGVNFFEVDEHLESNGLTFADFTQELKQKYQLNFVLDIVANHGSPAYSMPEDQPKYGEIYDQDGSLLADHQNIHPEKLQQDQALHQFYNTHTGLAQLSDINENNPAVLDYFTRAYLHWIKQGVHALRVDTIKEMPHPFWKKLFDNIRQQHPDIFIFGESYSYEAEFIAEHTKPENGGASVLDFPGRKAITEVFEKTDSDYSHILSYLHLDDGVYHNPYELMTFYDNHDMNRMNATDNGFIDANNWLFTSRGIPVIYYGSEINFMTGKPEHQGNRNYLGQQRIEQAKSHPIQQNLSRIAQVRKQHIALQKGLQINLEFKQNLASFYRVYQDKEQQQMALVLLNKGDDSQMLTLDKKLNSGNWLDALSGDIIEIPEDQTSMVFNVPAHGARVLILDQAASNPELLKALAQQQKALHK